MKRKLTVGDCVTGAGAVRLDVPAGHCSGHVVTAGAALVAECDGARQVLCAGVGRLDFDVIFPDVGHLEVLPFKAASESSVFLDRWPVEVTETGWRDSAPFVQLDLKDRNAISPEVEAVLNRMQQNMLIREAKLQAQIQRLVGGATSG